MTKKQDIIILINEAVKRFGRIDYLINNAGPFILQRKKLTEHTDSEWYEMIEGNLSAVLSFVEVNHSCYEESKVW
jgi:3-oxoacyl-[acyl-carrier protein] reductase